MELRCGNFIVKTILDYVRIEYLWNTDLVNYSPLSYLVKNIPPIKKELNG